MVHKGYFFIYLYAFNGPFPSCLLPVYQNESSCENIHLKMFPLQVHFRQIKLGNGGKGKERHSEKVIRLVKHILP